DLHADRLVAPLPLPRKHGDPGSAAATAPLTAPSAAAHNGRSRYASPRTTVHKGRRMAVALHDLVHLVAVQVVATPTPDPSNLNPAPVAPPGLEGIGSTFISWIKWILLICGVGGLMVCGIMMAVGRRQRSAFAADGAAGIPWVLGGLTLGSVAS